MQDDPFAGQKPEIEYPTEWGFRVVGTPESELRALIAETLADDTHHIQDVQPSSKGNYVSVRVTVTVQDEMHRNRIYDALSQAPAVKMVL